LELVFGGWLVPPAATVRLLQTGEILCLGSTSSPATCAIFGICGRKAHSGSRVIESAPGRRIILKTDGRLWRWLGNRVRTGRGLIGGREAERPIHTAGLFAELRPFVGLRDDSRHRPPVAKLSKIGVDARGFTWNRRCCENSCFMFVAALALGSGDSPLTEHRSRGTSHGSPLLP